MRANAPRRPAARCHRTPCISGSRNTCAARSPNAVAITSQGRPRTVFARALQNGNLYVAEALARELGRISLAEALELTILIARKDPPRYPRVAARWLQRLLEEHPS
jgi:hypothetical protein